MLFRWVQLSDIHFAYRNYDSNIMRDRLLQNLKELKGDTKFHALFLTGDITDKGGDYSVELEEFLAEVLKILELTRNEIFLVPGNHDVRRTVERSKLIEGVIGEEKSHYDKANNLSPDERSELLKAQQVFYDFYPKVKGENYPITNIHFVKKVGDEINLILLNTSWLCGRDEEEGKINIGMDKILELEKYIDNRNDINFIIAHHNHECFSKFQSDALKTFLSEKKIDFYLSGHVHESSIENIDDTIHCSCGQMKSDDISGRFCVGELNFETNDNVINFFYWNRNKSYWTIDPNVSIRAKNGNYRFQLQKITAPKQNINETILLYTLLDKSMNPSIDFVKNFSTPKIINVNDDFDLEELDWGILKVKNENFYNKLYKTHNASQFHILPLSPIPLLIHLGFLFQNSKALQTYQYDELNQQWVGKGKTKCQEIKILPSKFIKGQSDHIAIVISISAEIKEEDIQIVVPDDCSFLKISIEEPERRKVLYSEQVQELRQFLYAEIQKYLYDFQKVHLFYAGPAGLAIELGRLIRSNMWPSVYLYQFNFKREPKYEVAYIINE